MTTTLNLTESEFTPTRSPPSPSSPTSFGGGEPNNIFTGTNNHSFNSQIPLLNTTTPNNNLSPLSPPNNRNSRRGATNNGRKKESAKGKNSRMPSKKRNWEEFPGRNKFYCDGRLMMSRQTGVFYFTVILILGTMALFFGFDAPYLWTDLNPIVPLMALFLLLLVMSNLFRTSFTDPGVLPRATVAEAADIERQINAEMPPQENQYRPPPRTREVVINGQAVKLKYCFTCKMFRPPRSSHCSVCDNCILNFDHHCPWVGNCVGVRNYRHFYFFIVSLSFLCVYVFACVVVHIVLVAKEKTFILAIQETPGSLVVALVCFFSVWSVLGLAGFHTYLLTSNQTTNEDIKGTFSPKRAPTIINPFNRGSLFANCMAVVCPPIQPSLIDRRGLVRREEEVVGVPEEVYRSHMSSPAPSPAAQDQTAYGSVERADNAPHSAASTVIRDYTQIR